ncbi:unnamed protein product [Phytomonas sp. EM1]|nr:unnamed protein product [Phytomonas sp. EM1]|eukprot:CCW61804.1 unnamed protein product [Phytomonas sp. isolate EM1]
MIYLFVLTFMFAMQFFVDLLLHSVRMTQPNYNRYSSKCAGGGVFPSFQRSENEHHIPHLSSSSATVCLRPTHAYIHTLG